MNDHEKVVSMAVFDGADINPLFAEVLVAIGPDGVLAAETKGTEEWPMEPALIKEKLQTMGYSISEKTDEQLETAWLQVREYLAGERERFDLDVDLSLVDSEFQKSVLEACSRVYHGETVSYSQLATRIGNPGASRAVGTALGSNPVALIIPCHRVIRENGSSGDYASGPEVKKYLLSLEQA